ncbi:unnamed protein product [Brassica oleracea]|uniref:(rape) hypothetical protein n=1 Tax=Brassica napus TaxID=3708 RepID=A0A816KX13_BRANA|nr:unnamed protein product [Brassica napus]
MRYCWWHAVLQIGGDGCHKEANHLQNNLAAEKIRRGGDLRVEAEERRINLRLREEQDAAYRASLEPDQARESQRQEEEERLEREAAEADRKRK